MRENFYTLQSYLDSIQSLNLSPPEVYKEYYLMINEDTQISQMVQAIQGILSPKFTYWNLNYSDTEEYKFIKQQLDSNIKLNTLVSLASNCLFYGISIFQVIYDYDKTSKKTYIKKLIYREPATIKQFHFSDKEPYDIQSIEFFGRGPNNTIQSYNIPVEDLVIFTYNDDGGLINGTSLLRPTWKLYKIKKFLLKIMALGISKTAVPIPIGKLKKKVSNEKLQGFINILKGLNAGETSTAIIDDTEWTIEEFGGKFFGYPYDKFIDLINKEINKTILLNMLTAGIDTNAVFQTNIFEDILYGKLWEIASDLAYNINKKILKPLIDMNFSNPTVYPYLDIKKVGGRIGDSVDSKSLFMLTQNKVITVDVKLENWVRAQLGLPLKEE